MDGNNFSTATDGMFLPSLSSPSFTISERKVQNRKQPINRLPPELLSSIFPLAEEGERVFRPRDTLYITYQELATKVCSHWRDVAISTCSLWTYIHITRPPPNRLAALFLERAGASTLLDIDIEIRSRYCDKANIGLANWVGQVNLATELLGFLSLHGAGTSRWQSLSVCAKEPEVLFRTIESLNTEHAPSLRSLYLRWKTLGPNYAVEDRCLSYPRLFIESHSLSGPSLPNLRSVELVLVPQGFVLSRPSPLLIRLTRLSLTASSYLIPLAKLKELLVASPQLESLSLDSEFEYTDSPTTDEMLSRVRLPSLHSLSVGNINRPLWMLGVVQMIEAPIRKFTLFRAPYSDDEGGSFVDVLKYISTGQLRDQDAPSNIARASAPIYPSLRELDISKILSFEDEVEEMLFALSSVTRLSISSYHVDLLKRRPLVLPRLVRLKFSNRTHPQLGELLRWRAKQGFPIQVVELPRLDWQDDVEDELPESVTIVEHRDDDLGQDFDDSEQEEVDYWDPEDDTDEWLDGTEFNFGAHYGYEDDSEDFDEYSGEDD